MPPAIILLGIALGFGVYALAQRFDDPASADDPQLVQSAEQVAAQLVAVLGTHVTRAWTPPAAAAAWAETIAQAEQRYGIPQNLLLRQLDIESMHFAPDVVYGRVLSSAGAIGIAQLEPATAAELGVDPTDPVSSIDAAGRYMRSLFKQFGSWTAALAAYNWGPGHVARQGVAAAPQETRDYIKAIAGAVGVT